MLLRSLCRNLTEFRHRRFEVCSRFETVAQVSVRSGSVNACLCMLLNSLSWRLDGVYIACCCAVASVNVLFTHEPFRRGMLPISLFRIRSTRRNVLSRNKLNGLIKSWTQMDLQCSRITIKRHEPIILKIGQRQRTFSLQFGIIRSSCDAYNSISWRNLITSIIFSTACITVNSIWQWRTVQQRLCERRLHDNLLTKELSFMPCRWTVDRSRGRHDFEIHRNGRRSRWQHQIRR